MTDFGGCDRINEVCTKQLRCKLRMYYTSFLEPGAALCIDN